VSTEEALNNAKWVCAMKEELESIKKTTLGSWLIYQKEKRQSE
jgi:hypothetical protein